MRAFTFFVVCCALAAGVPLAIRPATNSTESIPFAGWPAQFEGRALTELPLSTRELQFAAGFPGRIARFSDGEREIIFRWVMRESRAVHPAADCFRGIGYAIRPLPLHADANGSLWGRFEARRGRETLIVRERIYSLPGAQTWADVSNWYWQAVFGRSKAPWLAVTVAETMAEGQ